MEVVRDGVVVELGEVAVLGADEAREVAEVVGGERQVGVQRLADRTCRCPTSRRPRAARGSASMHVGDRVAGCAARSRGARAAPGRCAPCGRRRAPRRCPSAVPRATSVNGLPVTGEMFSKYCALDGPHPLAADEVLVARLERDQSRSADPGAAYTVMTCLLVTSLSVPSARAIVTVGARRSQARLAPGLHRSCNERMSRHPLSAADAGQRSATRSARRGPRPTRVAASAAGGISSSARQTSTS